MTDPVAEPSAPFRAAEGLRVTLAAAALVLVVLGPALVGGRSTLSFDPAHPLYPAPWAEPVEGERPPINPITSDIDFFVVPGLMRLRALGADGTWDDTQLLGYPLRGNLPFPFLHPVTAWFEDVDPVTTMDVLLALHLVAALVLAYRAVRLLGGRPVAATVGALSFAFSAWMATRWHLPQIAWTTCWWPGLVACVEKLRQGRRAGAVAEGAVWTAGGFVTGFPQAGVAYVGGLVVLLLLDRELRTRATLGCAALMVLLGLALAAPQFALLSGVYPHSMRTAEATREATVSLGLSPGALAGGVLPEVFGRPSRFAEAEPPAATMEAWLPHRLLLGDDVRENVVENALYPGLVILVLLGALARRGVGRPARHLAALAALALVGALVFPWLARGVPALDALGASHIKRLLILTTASLPLAGALALQAVVDRKVRLPVVVPLLLLGLVAAAVPWARSLQDPAAAAFAGDLVPQVLRQGLGLVVVLALVVALRAGRRWAAPVLCAVVALDLLSLAWTFNPFPPQREEFLPATASVRWLQEREGRVAVLGSSWLLPPTLAGVHGLRSLHGVAPLLSRRTAELLGCIEGPLVDPADPRVVQALSREASLDHALLDLLEVGTVVHADPGLAERLGRTNAYVDEREGLAALDRPGRGPRAFLAHGLRVEPEDEARLAWLADPGRDLHATVLVEEPLFSPALPEVAAPSAAVVVSERPGRVELEVSASAPGLLVLVESWSPGWEALVDGQPGRVVPAHHALLGVPVEAGGHRVVLEHHVSGWGASRAISLGALIACLGLALAGFSRRPVEPVYET